MSSPAGIMTTQISQSDQIHLVVGARDSHEPTDTVSIPVATEVPRNNNSDMVLNSLGEVAAPHADSDAQKLEGQLESAGFKLQSDSTGILLVHKGEDCMQTRIHQDLALQQDDLAPTRKVLDVPRREVDLENMRLHAKLQSVSRRVMELERRLGSMRENRFLRRERIQLGLDISVAGERGVSVPGFPFMMVLALIIVIISGAYKYYAFSA